MNISEVIIVLDKKGQTELKKLLEQEGKDSRLFKTFTEETDDKRLSPSENEMLFSWSNIKWYSDEEEFFEKLIEDLEEENYFLARMGESFGDYEYFGELQKHFAIYPKQELELEIRKEVS